MDTPEPPNPVHMVSAPTTRWSTVNFGEAIQGVQTPLSWAIWDHGMEFATRKAFRALGVLGASEMPPPASAEGRMSGIFYGRAAGNINFFRMIGERIPGSSADVLEEKLFGEVSDTPIWGEPGGLVRNATIAAKFPIAAWRAPNALRHHLADQRRWWRRNTIEDPPTTLAAAQHLVRTSAARFTESCVGHTVVSMIGPQLLEALTSLAEAATGQPELGVELATGYGGLEETQLIADLWAASRGRLSLAEVRGRHGYHGPDEGKLETRSWREDLAPVHTILRGYQQRDTSDPAERERTQTARREAAAARVLAALPGWKRPQAILAMKLASIYIPARELGKTAFLHALDGARCGARVAGRILAEQGRLADPEDVFFLTVDELTAPGGSTRDIALQRRANHERYLAITLPRTWNGTPTPIADAGPTGPTRARVGRLRGVGVVGDKVTGRARVIDGPVTAEFAPGDILVCATTDPSWTPLFLLADALVIDTGGQMSHGAIVARELGVCCVINTGTGTRDIPDGAMITVDGASGIVEILD
jgi:pyruvate,water dikinase